MTSTTDSRRRDPPADPGGAAHLGLWGCISIIVGIVVGVSIFKAPAAVFANVPTVWHGLTAWLLGGLLSLAGALCYVELATTYPRMGGDYVYLSRAYHPGIGYLFGWSRLAVMQTGSIGALAYVLADYFAALFPAAAPAPAWTAAAAVALLTLLNIIGITLGKTAQNILTVSKTAAVLGLALAGFWLGEDTMLSGAGAVRGPGFGLAMILVLYSFGGWSEAAFVAAEMRDRRRNIPRALIFSIAAITVVYLAVNLALLAALGFEGLRASPAPAAQVLELALGAWGRRAISVVVILSALGALNGTILTGSRVYVAMGAEHRCFALLGRWSSRRGAPVWSLAVQGAVTLAMILAVGTHAGRSLLDRLLRGLGRWWPGLGPLPWDSYGGGFETLVAGSAPVFWFFMLLTGMGLIILRLRDRHIQRVYRAPLHPVMPLVFCATSLYMLYSSYRYAQGLLFFGVALAAAGIPFYFIGRTRMPGRGRNCVNQPGQGEAQHA